MTDDRYAQLEISELRSLDSICDAFEQQATAGQPDVAHKQDFEQYLEQTPEHLREFLFGELLTIELQQMACRGLLPLKADYESRFPNRLAAVRSIFERVTSDPIYDAVTQEDSPNLNCPTREHRSPAAHRPGRLTKSIDKDHPLPEMIGRFRVERLIGQGGFGLVYRAHDDQLDRTVAIKVPSARVVDTPPTLTEAQNVAKLVHPHIVPVYEVGSCKDVGFFIVSRCIDGTSLAARMKPKVAGDPLAVAKTIATLADALQYAHEQGLVHRDIKPGNILLDEQERPYLVDFGLALPEEQFGQPTGYVGTPAYMSPEQAAGEGHHVDGRSDIFSLGIVFYELLAGRRPFSGTSQGQVMQNVMTSEPRPLRQYNGDLQPELERICMKALSKRISRRYSTARDMAEDLHNFLAISSSGGKAQVSTTLVDSATPTSSESQSSSNASANGSEIAVTPRGLRSYDSRDKDFFLRLLPGPRTRDGLPESVWFWKTQIEEWDRDKTFSVGLIYGPSGCGKSSLVKAGLLPQLSDDVTTIYIEATGDGTEDRLQQQLKIKFSELAENLDLGQTMAAIRRRPMMSGHKLLVIIDQFEQWLHALHASDESRLLKTLRQCDGQHIQFILMVRDEFWLSISRLMLELDVDLVPGHNIALVDLFDEDHARQVLVLFGQAFGKLPRNAQEMTKEQVDFLDRVIGELSQDGKVVPVRLAMMSEMLKGKPWTTETLKMVGGTEGVGVAFLNDTFDSRGSNPAYRIHREATQQVLKSLLPEEGSDLKGHMRSHDELMAISGYQNQTSQFEQLIRILGSELRLITPSEIADSDSGNDPVAPTRLSGYQLTHDYLVHTVRNWVTQNQRKTRRGRAELRLEERTREWQSSRSSRYLPWAWEYANLRLFSRKKFWNTPQRQMMKQAGRHHGLRWSGGLVVTLLIAASLLFFFNRMQFRHQSEQAEIAVATLCNSRGHMLPRAIDDLAQLPRGIVVSKLRGRIEVVDPHERLNLFCALAAIDGLNDLQELLEQIELTANPDVPNLVTALRHTNIESLKLLRAMFDDLDEAAFMERARVAILALYLGDIVPAKVMCRRASDPIPRTWFIEQHGIWHGKISELVEIVEGIDDPDLQSGLCLAVGSTELDPIFPGERKTWQSLATEWYGSPDSGVHGAAGWMLRRWKMELPDIATMVEPPEDKKWHVTPSGMTMVKIPAGTFLNRMKGDWTPFDEDMPSQKITVSRDFLMSDREVSLGQFRKAMEDPDVGLRERPYLRYDEDDDAQAELYRDKTDKVHGTLNSVRFALSEKHPILRVSWIQAVMYCNWLSRKEGLQPCYERTGKIHKFPYANRWTEDWRLMPGRNGYRLPTNAEWELACRASTTTDFSFGDDTQFIARYAVHKTSYRPSVAELLVEPCGSRMPNGWGLFDMHGNVQELCNDWVRGFRHDTQSKTDPKGPGKPVYLDAGYSDSILVPNSTREAKHWRKIRCGGDFTDVIQNKASFQHSDIPVISELSDTGFRVVRSIE